MAGGESRASQSHSSSQKALVIGPDGVAAGADAAICGDLRAELHAVFTSTPDVGPHHAIRFNGGPYLGHSLFIWPFAAKRNIVADHSAYFGRCRPRYLFRIGRSEQTPGSARADWRNFDVGG